jgi:NTP pyrophosphatase (non-canonical NTP hydrolase)
MTEEIPFELRGHFDPEAWLSVEAMKEVNEKLDALEESVEVAKWDVMFEDIHSINKEKGFWGEPEMMDKYVAKIGLIHSELTEILEALRKSQGTDKVTEEFADVLIRTFDLYHVLVEAGEADPHLFKVMNDKIETNRSRAPKHGNRWG